MLDVTQPQPREAGGSGRGIRRGPDVPSSKRTHGQVRGCTQLSRELGFQVNEPKIVTQTRFSRISPSCLHAKNQTAPRGQTCSRRGQRDSGGVAAGVARASSTEVHAGGREVDPREGEKLLQRGRDITLCGRRGQVLVPAHELLGSGQTEGPPVRQRGGQSSNDTWKLHRSLDSWLHSPAPGPEETRRPRDAAPAPGACLLLVPASAWLLASRGGGGGRYQQHRLTQRESARALATLYQDSKATVPRARQATRCCGRRGGSQPSVPHCPDPLLPAAARPSLGPRQR